jgi:hypothetical protein
MDVESDTAARMIGGGAEVVRVVAGGGVGAATALVGGLALAVAAVPVKLGLEGRGLWRGFTTSMLRGGRRWGVVLEGRSNRESHGRIAVRHVARSPWGHA